MQIKSVAVGILRARCYVISGTYNGKEYVLMIDPGGNPAKIQKLIEKPITHIAFTHAHFDHIGAVGFFHNLYPEAKICIGEYEDISEKTIKEITRTALGDFYFEKMNFPYDAFIFPKPDILLKDGENFLEFKIIHTPGHSKGSICFYNENENVLISGDTLFYDGQGRTDLLGNQTDMEQSLKKLMQLKPETEVYPGHNLNTTIERERKNIILSNFQN